MEIERETGMGKAAQRESVQVGVPPAAWGGTTGSESFVKLLQAGLGTAPLEAHAVVAFAARALLRVYPLLESGSTAPGTDRRDLAEVVGKCLCIAAAFASQTASADASATEADGLFNPYAKLTRRLDEGAFAGTEVSIGNAGVALKYCVLRPSASTLRENAAKTAGHAQDAIWHSSAVAVRGAEVARFRAALSHDLQSLLCLQTEHSIPVGEEGPLGPLWPTAFGASPGWYPRLRGWLGQLTARGEWSSVLGMPEPDGRRQHDPALQQALEAFDEVRLPRPPLTKLTALTPEEGIHALRTLKAYLDSVGDPVANAVQHVLAALDGQAFNGIEGTREFVRLAQSLLDRTGYAVVCPTCDEPGKLDVAGTKLVPTGSIRVKHGPKSTHGGSSSVRGFRLKRPAD